MDDWPRHDVSTWWFANGEDRVEAYRRSDRMGHGPCVSVYVGGTEVLRLDVFPGEAHEHIAALPGQPRLYFPRDLPFTDLVRLAVSNLVEHTPAVSHGGPDRTELAAAGEWACTALLELGP